MTTLKIDIEDDIAREVEESARRERKTISEWIRERIQQDSARIAAMEARAMANGYPPEWLALYGSLANDESFAGPMRSAVRPVIPNDEN